MHKLILALALMATITVVAVHTSSAFAQLGNGKPPISVVGNPHGFSTGPPIPSCSADFHQGPPNDPSKGCKLTP